MVHEEVPVMHTQELIRASGKVQEKLEKECDFVSEEQ